MPSWNPSLSIGHRAIDAQHEELFSRFDALVAALSRGDRAEVARMFEFLGAYVTVHFADEERLMRDTGFPGVNVHKAAHDRFVREYAELRALFEASGASHAVGVKTKTWVGGWLSSHIGGVDQALGRHLARGAA